LKKKTLAIAGCLTAAFTLALVLASSAQLFEGALDVVHYRAPNLPSPFPIGGDFSRDSAPPLIQQPGQMAGRAPAAQPQSTPSAEPSEPVATNGLTWINSGPLTMEALRGKVVMIDFWDYTCINCIRTFDANKRWYARYHRYGFDIIGVDDPEFGFAFSVDNSRRAIKRFQLTYPNVVDGKREIWNLYHNDSWPCRYLIDAHGIVRFVRSGEGGDHAFEDAIRLLLNEAHPGIVFPASYSVPTEENAFSLGCGIPTPEMYVGDIYGRGVLANPQGYHNGKAVNFALPASVRDGTVVLGGKWQARLDGMTYRGKKSRSGSAGEELEMRYHARQLYGVINVVHGHPERLYITQDGKDLTQANRGMDVQFDAQGHSYVFVRAPRLYYLVANSSFGSHLVVLTPTAPGITVDSFTFGNNCQTQFSHL
jgi:hypothetical protein